MLNNSLPNMHIHVTVILASTAHIDPYSAPTTPYLRRAMSSLSGALDESALKPVKPDPSPANDVEMHAQSNNAASDSESAGHQEQDEEMADLFGNDDVEEQPKHERFEISRVSSGDKALPPNITEVRPPQPQDPNQTDSRHLKENAARHLNMRRTKFRRTQAM